MGEGDQTVVIAAPGRCYLDSAGGWGGGRNAGGGLRARGLLCLRKGAEFRTWGGRGEALGEGEGKHEGPCLLEKMC